MKFISLFAGIGGLDLGLERAGMECVAQVEIDDFCQKVLTKHWPSVPKYKDVRDVGKHNLPTADLICGGFPCQDVSIAGLRKGLEGKRSTLWTEFYRIVCEIRPRWIIIENVAGLLSSDNGEFARKILRELAEAGFDVEWVSLHASDFGASHRRERVFLIANSNRFGLETNAADEVLFKQTHYTWEAGYIRSVHGKNLVSHFPSGEALVSNPANVGSDYGISPRLDRNRIKALGNAVVPQVAEFIGHSVMKAEACLTNACSG